VNDVGDPLPCVLVVFAAISMKGKGASVKYSDAPVSALRETASARSAMLDPVHPVADFQISALSGMERIDRCPSARGPISIRP
jgi:hypothetical protein